MADSLPYYTWEEVAQHTTRANGVWVVIEGNVYDVTKFLDEHPGGEDVLIENAGKDATTAFLDVGHSSDAIELRKTYLIGRISEEATPVQKTSRAKAVGLTATGIILPALVVAAVAVGVYLAYRRWKK